MKLAILGPPGSGKGTQSTRLADRLGIVHISTGDILRSAVKDKTPLGKKAHEYLTSGALVPDELMVGIVKERISRKDCNKGFILDGFPRTIPQAEMLDKIIFLDGVIFFQVPEEECVRRLTNRRICSKCGLNYNPATHPPILEGKCDHCHGPLTVREDDKPETVRERLRVYHRQTEPLIKYYKKDGRLITVDASKEPDPVFEELLRLVQAVEKGKKGAPA